MEIKEGVENEFVILSYMLTNFITLMSEYVLVESYLFFYFVLYFYIFGFGVVLKVLIILSLQMYVTYQD